MKKYLRILFAIIAIFACVALSACSADSDYDVGEDASGEPILLYTYDIDAEAKDVGASKSAIDAKCEAFGGYYENRDESYYQGECTSFSVDYRIPNNKAEEFVRYIEDNVNIEYKDVEGINAGTNASDTRVEIEAIETQILLYSEMLDDYSLSISERESIINKIAELSKKLNRLEASLVISDYTLVSLRVSEQPSVLDSIMGFLIVVFFIGFYPTCTIVAIIVVVTVIKKNNKKKAQETK